MARTSQSAPLARIVHALGAVRTPLRIALGLIAVALGAVLVLAPITVHGIAIIAGCGLAAIGIAAVLPGDASAGGASAGGARTSTLTRRIGAIMLIVVGLIMAAWPVAGAPWLAFLAGSALVMHGALALVAAVVDRTATLDHRVSGVCLALATVLVGGITFSWPVLTLLLFRYGVGAWLVLLGLQLLLDPVIAAMRARREVRSAAATAASGTSPGNRRPAALATPWRWARTIASGIALVASVALALGSGFVLGGVPMPAPDEFYAAPAAAQVPDAPGQLIRSEPLTTGVAAGAEAWKILYTTTHPDGSPAISSGTVIAPADRTGEALPLLSIAHGTSGVVAACAPSLSATPFSDGAGAALTEMVTQHGWAAVTSDYIGLGTAGTHPYLVGEAEARNVLDASRAAQQLSGLALSTDTVVWGHSQGGQGALWTGQEAASYAPELTVKGIAAFAPAANLYGLADADKNDPAGKTVSAYIATTWNDVFPELDLEQHLTPGSAGGVEKIRELCFSGHDGLAAILLGTQVPNQIFPDSALAGPFGDLLKQQTPDGPFPAPVLVAQGLADPLVKPQLQLDYVEGRCAAGVALDYRTYPGLNHGTLVAEDSPLTPQLVQWTLDRWDDKPATPNCDDLPNSVAD
ncbi:lipase family protein [Leucobacter japonicus]|uniref:lipase family protein n=1 Tax=Leucobacter japonicus TaxID=1461259 RepID=UPI0009E2B784|nr:lipase family protein [Leucobacter japonicus]